MNSNATFINAVMDVRIEQGVFHFTLGEMLLGKTGKTEFVPALRAVIPADEAEGLFSFLCMKAQESKGPTPPLTSKENDPRILNDDPEPRALKKKIFTSSGANKDE